jgi:hypothetical protein
MKTFLIVTSMMCLCAVGAQAGLGRTDAELEKRFGKSVRIVKNSRDPGTYYQHQGMTIVCQMRGENRTCNEILLIVSRKVSTGDAAMLATGVDWGRFWKNATKSNGNDRIERSDGTAYGIIERTENSTRIRLLPK